MRPLRMAARQRIAECLTRITQQHEQVLAKRHGPRDLRAELEERDAIIELLAEALDASQYFNAVPLTGKADSEYADARRAAIELGRYALAIVGRLPREPVDAT